MNMFARFDENTAMTLQDIKETKRYGRTDARTHGQRENSIPTTNKVCGGYKKDLQKKHRLRMVCKKNTAGLKHVRGHQPPTYF